MLFFFPGFTEYAKEEYYKVQKEHLCAFGNVTGHEKGMICFGDSGGPLVLKENGRFVLSFISSRQIVK